jgi:NADH dehydrogenase
MGIEVARLAPLMAAKHRAEEALRSTTMRVVVVRPDMFQEVWLAPLTGIDPAAGKALIYGRGDMPHRYVATDDVARLCVHLALVADPPRVVEFGGPEPLSRLEAVAAFERATGRRLRVRHVPRPALRLGSIVLAGLKPELASLMGMALFSDTHPATWDDAPLRAVGIEPRPVTAFIDATAAGMRAQASKGVGSPAP